MSDLEPRDLYGLPLEGFTERRNALARELRAKGRREEAAAVAKLRKPSVAAWAVNQLVRTQRREIDALFAAGDALQRAQAQLMAGRGDPAALRQAVEAERAAARQLTATARGLLDADGHELTAARLEQVTETLHAAALDDDARAKVRGGCLERELRHIGLGALGAAAAPRAVPKAAPRRQTSAAARKAAREAEERARRELEAATRELHAAQARRERAAEELRDAEEALAQARERATEAHDRARQPKQGDQRARRRRGAG